MFFSFSQENEKKISKMKKALLLCVIFMAVCATKTSTPLKTGNTRSFQFKYTVVIESTGGKKLELWIPVPQSNEVQTISNLKFNINGLQHTIEDEKVHGNKYLYINDVKGTTKATNISMIFDVVRREHHNVMYNNVDPQKYFGAYSTVPTGDIFEKIIADNNLSKNDVRGIYDYVSESMHYATPKSVDDKYYKDPWLSPDEKYGMKQVGRDNVVNLYQKSKKDGGNHTFGNGNSIYACDIGVGNCTDYHSYFLSLSRTIGIPARFHMGFSIPTDQEGKVSGYHCWADYYVDGKGWYPIDISEGDKDPNRKDYYFGTVDNNRIKMIVGRDFILEGYEEKTSNLFIYPIMEVNDEKSSAFIQSFSYKSL